MHFLERYQAIKSSFKGILTHNDGNLLYDDIQLQLIGREGLSIPNFMEKSPDQLTLNMSNFYDEVKFPNYDQCDDYASLIDKAANNLFVYKIDQELGYGVKVLELGCGTGQLSLYLARGNREVYGVDISNGSLLLGEEFRVKNQINNAYFMKMDVFDLKFKSNTFDFTISNGVLHHTKDPRKAFKCLVDVTKPGGLIVIGLYHKHGRFFTRVKQKLTKVFGTKIYYLDRASLRIKDTEKRNSWITDQFFNPHESLHTPKEVYDWFVEDDVDFLNLLPHSDEKNIPLFQERKPPSFSPLQEILMAFNRTQIQEGGFFVIVGRKKKN